MNNLQDTAVVALHKAAIEYCDSLTASGKDQREAVLATLALIMGEAALVGQAAGLTVEDFQEVAKTLYESAESLAQSVRAEREKQ